MSARPLVGSGDGGRSLARTFKCFDHKEMDGIDGLVTITGGKATTCRAMAEKTVDLVCQKLGDQGSLHYQRSRRWFRTGGITGSTDRREQ